MGNGAGSDCVRCDDEAGVRVCVFKLGDVQMWVSYDGAIGLYWVVKK